MQKKEKKSEESLETNGYNCGNTGMAKKGKIPL